MDGQPPTARPRDPIGLAGGINLYGYANGDPISYSDPYGLCAQGDTVPQGGKVCQFKGESGAIESTGGIGPAEVLMIPAGRVVKGGQAALGLLSRLRAGLGALLARRMAAEAGQQLAVQSVEEILTNPQVLRTASGVASPDDVAKILPAGWVQTAGTRGAHASDVRAFRELLPNGKRYSGRVMRWHPGGGHHGPHPYWAVSDGQTLTRVGPQF